MTKKIILISGLILAVSKLYSQSAPKYSNDFLDIGVGADALAMGKSVVASVSGVTSGYWNPAGLMGMTGDIQIALMHDEYFAGIAQDEIER